MSTARQLLAVFRLLLRQWTRMSPRLRGGGPPEPKRGLSALLLRALLLVVMAFVGVQYARLVELAEQPLPTTAWVVFGIGTFAFALGFTVELPMPRAPASPFKSSLLDFLPLTHGTRLFVQLLQTIAVAPLGVAFACVVSPGLPGVLVGLGLHVFAALWGLCAAKALRQLLPAYWAARASWLPTVFLLAGLMTSQNSVLLAEKGLAPPFGSGLARALHGASSPLELAGLGALLWVRLERRSVDQDLPLRSGFVAAQLRAPLGPAGVERLLNAREPGGRVYLPFAMATIAVMTAGVLYIFFIARARTSLGDSLRNVLFLLAAQLVLQWGIGRATRGAVRDSLARPLLGCLPLTPRDTLAAKVRVLRRDLLVMVAPLSLLLVHGWLQPADFPDLAWRLVALFAATALLGHGVVPVAFLTLGLGQVRPRGGAYGSLESLLLVFPFVGVLLAPNPLSALISLGCLFALTLEARRAAARVVDWLDDPAAEHGTELWRALVLFAAFQAAQLLLGQLLSFLPMLLSGAQQLAIVYIITGTGLYFGSVSQQSTPSLPFRASRAAFGVAGGALAALVAFGYVGALRHLGFDGLGLQMTGLLDQVLISLAIVCVAPLAEERFFRGWLLLEIEKALGKPRLAAVVSALAFAAVHPLVSFLPVFGLGLVTAVLAQRTRSLTACIVAHAVYNAVALLH